MLGESFVDENLPTLRLESEADFFARAIDAASRFFLQHPWATHSLIAHLAEEGRRFGETDEGARWRSWLVATDIPAHCQRLWDASPLKLVGDGSPDQTPQALVELLARRLSKALNGSREVVVAAAGPSGAGE